MFDRKRHAANRSSSTPSSTPSSSWSTWSVWAAAGFLGAAVLAPFAACVEENIETIPGNLLVGLKAETGGVPQTLRLVDGQLAVEGDHWDTGITAKFDNASGSVTWDLGATKPIRCALVQGDNNDVYVVSTSPDGKAWQTLWEAPPVDGAGMRTRQAKVDGSGRYVRLTARDGDQMFSVGELSLWSDCPKGWPKIALMRIEGPPVAGSEPASSWSVSLGILVAAAVALILLSRKRRPPPASPADATGMGEPPAAP